MSQWHIAHLWQHPKSRSPLGWGLVIVVAIPLALVDLSTCWVIVHQETYQLLWRNMEELRLIERRSRHYHAVCNCSKTVCLSMLRYRSCVTVVWKKKIGPSDFWGLFVNAWLTKHFIFLGGNTDRLTTFWSITYGPSFIKFIAYSVNCLSSWWRCIKFVSTFLSYLFGILGLPVLFKYPFLFVVC